MEKVDEAQETNCEYCIYYGGTDITCDNNQSICMLNNGIVFTKDGCEMFYDFDLARKLIEKSRVKGD